MWKKENKVKELKLSRNIYHEMILRERQKKKTIKKNWGKQVCDSIVLINKINNIRYRVLRMVYWVKKQVLNI